MSFLRLVALAASAVALLVLAQRAWGEDVRHQWLDLRAWDATLVVSGSLAAGLALLFALRRRAPSFRLGPASAVALGFLAAASIHGAAHVEPVLHDGVVAQEVPPVLGPLYLVLAFLAPAALAALGRVLRDEDVLLAVAWALTLQDGALFFLDESALVLAAGAALLFQLDGEARNPGRRALALAVAACGLLLVAGSRLGPDPGLSVPPSRAVVALLLLVAATALRPRSVRETVFLLGVPLVGALVLAGAEALLSHELARRYSREAAELTRLPLYRRHPNFLAPLFATGGVVSAALALLGRGRWRLLGAASFLALAHAVWRTDSNAGKLALAAGCGFLLAALVFAAAARRIGLARAGAIAAVALLLAGGATAAALTRPGVAERAVSLLKRGRKSLDYRLDAWRNASHVIAERPALGVGLGTFLLRTEFPPTSRFANEREVPHPHNFLLYIAQAGGLGALAAAVLWFVLLAGGWIALLPGRGGAARLAAAVVAALLAQSFANLFDLGLAFRTAVPWPWFLATGLLWSLAPRGRAGALLPGVRALVAFVALGLFWSEGVRPARAASLVRGAQAFGVHLARTSLVEEVRERMIARLEEALALDRYAAARETLVRALEDRGDEGDLERAEELLREAVQLAPDDGERWSRLGRFLAVHGRHAEAAVCLEAPMRGIRGSRDPDGDRAGAVLEWARANRWDRATAALRASLEKDYEILHSLDVGRGPGGRLVLFVDGRATPVDVGAQLEELFAARRLEQRREGDLGRKPWLDLFHAFEVAGLGGRAEKVLDFVEQAVPSVESHSLWMERGRLAERRGEYGRAAECYARAAELAPQVPWYRELADRARSLAEGRRPEVSPTALRVLRSVGEGLLDGRNGYVPALERLASEFAQAGRPLDAADALRRKLLFAREPEERAALWVRIAALAREGGDEEAAGTALLEALDEMSCRPFLSASRFEGAGGDLAQTAGRAFAELAASDPTWIVRYERTPGARRFVPAANRFRMTLLLGLGRFERALEEAEVTLLQDEDDAVAIATKKRALAALGRDEDLARFERSLGEPSPLEGVARRVE